jgi:hypothetical protein
MYASKLRSIHHVSGALRKTEISRYPLKAGRDEHPSHISQKTRDMSHPPLVRGWTLAALFLSFDIYSLLGNHRADAALVGDAKVESAGKIAWHAVGTVFSFPRVMQHLTTTNFLGTVEGWWLWAPCASWQVPSAERYTGPWTATTENPILVIGNKYDPWTRFANSVKAAHQLGNAFLLELDGYGHTSDAEPSACIDEAVAEYLVTTKTPLPGTICQPNHAPFDPDFNEPLLREMPVD